MIEDICTFNREVLEIKDRPLTLLSKDEFDYLIKAFNEEITEVFTAHRKGNIVDFVDGVLDLCYFAIGGLYRAGLTPDQITRCFNVIHAANMQKKQGIQAKRGGKAVDAVKPEGWVPPERLILNILEGK